VNKLKLYDELTFSDKAKCFLLREEKLYLWYLLLQSILTIHSVIDDFSSSLPTILILKNTSLKLAIRLIDKTLIFNSFRIFFKCLLILISGHDQSPQIKRSFVFFIGIPWHLELLRMKFLFFIYWISIIVIDKLKNKK